MEPSSPSPAQFQQPAAATATGAVAGAGAGANPEKRRRRPPLACVACRRRKVRCDRKMPCQNCVRARRGTSCTYVPDDRLEPREGFPGFHDGINRPSPHRPDGVNVPMRTTSYLSPTATNSSNNNNNNNNNNNHRGTTPTPTVAASHGSQQGDGLASASGPGLAPGNGSHQDAAALAERVRQLEQQLQQVLDSNKSGTAGSKPAQSNHATPPTASQFMGDEHWKINDGKQTGHYVKSNPWDEGSTQVMLAKSRYLGSSHWMHGVTLFPRTTTLMLFLESLKSDKSSETYQAIVACKTLGRSIKATRVPRLLSLNFGQNIPSRDLADKLLDGYFRTFEKVYRILHVPSFRLEYGRYWQNPQGARETFIIQLQLCMAIGAVLHDDKYSLRRQAVGWVYEARFWLLQPSEKSRINLSGLQVWCLIHLARDICGVGSDLVWASAGTLMRMALYTGMHRDPEHLPKMSLLAAEMRRRLWATILEILVESSMESGGPPLISSNDYDTKPPGNYNDDDLLCDDEPAQTPSPQPITTLTDTSVQLALLNSIKVRLNIVAYLNEFRSVANYDKTLALNSDLTGASRSLDALLRVYQSHEPGLSTFQLCTLEHTIQRYFLALHFPWLGFAKNDPRYFFSRKLCVEIAVRNQKEGLIHGFLGAVEGSPAPDDFGRLLICASGGFRYIGTQCLLTLILELFWDLEEARDAMRAVTGGCTGTTNATVNTPATCPATSSSSSTPSARPPRPQPASTPGMGVNVLGSMDPGGSGCENEVMELLRRATQWMRARMTAGEVNVKGYLFGCAMIAEAEALQRGVGDDDLYAVVKQASAKASADSLAILKDIYAEEMARSTAAATAADVMSGMASEPRYTGMDGTQVPIPAPGQSGGVESERLEAVDPGSGGGAMTDWDWEVLQDPNYNFNLSLNLGAMDVIFGNEL